MRWCLQSCGNYCQPGIPYSGKPESGVWIAYGHLSDMQDLKKFTSSSSTLRKLLEGMFHQNKKVNKEKGTGRI